MAHNATGQKWGDEWRGGCDSCGWIQARPKRGTTRTQAQAQRSAERHNREATARDEKIHLHLYGPRKGR